MKICENIALLRRQRNLTQEELAKALGVTNQAVSKWESGQNCPDIGLLPQMADLFRVSLDELMGRKPLPGTENIEKIKEQAERERDRAQTLSMLHQVQIMHSYFLRKAIKHSPDEETDKRLEEKAAQGKWGFSCIDRPEIMTCMKKGTVIFSDNRLADPESAQLKSAARHMAVFSDPKALKIMTVLHILTVEDEEKFASPADIAAKCRLGEKTVREYFDGVLADYLQEKEDSFRIEGMYMHLLPVMSLLSDI
ncbi:MAG: helix-turn-helix transcriptional regulator [Oscillospiraceae bacterium]|nr:helix-turn-helix transcriptional regulator [Oscillospiraceae bacterium]